MIKAYFKIAWRNLVKNIGYSTINIAGLAVGMAVALLIGLWIYDEISFDRYHKNHSRVGQVFVSQAFNNKYETDASIVVPLGNALRTNFANDFKRVALSSWNTPHILAVGEKKISRSGMWAETDLPAILSLNIRGNINALTDPSSLILSQSVAKALFGDDDPVGKTVRVDGKAEMKVGAVYQDLPTNTTLNETKFLLSWNNAANGANTRTEQWKNHGSQLFVELNNHIDFTQATTNIKDLLKPHIKEWKEELLVHPMDKWHLYNEFENGKVSGGRIQYIWLFVMIGIFVLVLACINFMNLSTARSEKRAKEIGIRKAIGSLKQQLIGQFLCESLLLTFIAMFISLILVFVTIPFFNVLAGKNISVPTTNPVFWLSTVGFAFVTGLLAGSYPALYLSGLKTIKVLKGSFRVGGFSLLPRQTLIILQFTVSIALIIGTVIVFQQVRFTKNRPVGYSRKGLITIDMNTPDLFKNYNGLRNELLQTGTVADMAEANSTTTDIWSNNTGFEWSGKDPGSSPIFGTIAVTHDYGKTVGWQITAGRDFSRNFSDTSAFVLNESAVKLTGIQNPLGKTINWNGKAHLIIGIAKDMVMESAYENTHPTIFHLEYGWVNKILVRIAPTASVSDALSKIKGVFNKMNPSSPFEYQFADEAYAQQFAVEERIGKLAGFFAILAILISCLGLFGLASFTAEQRTKEIGIRKVIGASVFNLWQLLSKDFVVLVILSCCIAIPVAYYFMNNWLQKYQYRTDMSWWIFAVAVLGALIITLFTVSFQAIKAAITNPVKSLRTE
ncbi:ABC transporter permease [Niastella sp. OAS944]|uniref:ABC transporter permease n=1 Tax=Niastella sp. OAS944 TaxID=2664089 RepID=UPI003474891B|nr:ABC-type antimicrobial peptide transport system permease subunit [Chitinophagaceae bacterium OAS944]